MTGRLDIPGRNRESQKKDRPELIWRNERICGHFIAHDEGRLCGVLVSDRA